MQSFNSFTVLGFFSLFFAYSLFFTTPQKKKSIGVRSGEHGGHSMLPVLPNQRCVKTLLTLLRPGFFLLSMSGGGGGGGGRFDPTFWQLITFEPLTIAIPFLLR